MKSLLLKHRNLLIFSSWFSIQSMTIIHPVVGKLCNWSYHHILDPLCRVDVPIPWLLEYPLLTAHKCTSFHSSSAWPRGQLQQVTGWWRNTRTPPYDPTGNTSIRLTGSRASCRMFRDLNCSVIMIQLLPVFPLSLQVYLPRVFPSKYSAGNAWSQSLFPGKPI